MRPTILNNPRALARRFGKAAFMFFLAKGLMWLAAPWLFFRFL